MSIFTKNDEVIVTRSAGNTAEAAEPPMSMREAFIRTGVAAAIFTTSFVGGSALAGVFKRSNARKTQEDAMRLAGKDPVAIWAESQAKSKETKAAIKATKKVTKKVASDKPSA